jgi:hypothetical protein
MGMEGVGGYRENLSLNCHVQYPYSYTKIEVQHNFC